MSTTMYCRYCGDPRPEHQITCGTLACADKAHRDAHDNPLLAQETIDALLAPRLAVPTVHLNGTSGQELAEGYAAAMNAINDAQTAASKTAPNMRDFYIQQYGGEDAFRAARAAHYDRLEKLAALHAEFYALLRAVQEQNDRKSAARRR